MPKRSKPRSAPRAAAASLLTEDEKAFIHLSLKMGREKAASEMGLNADAQAKLLKSRPVKEYLKQYQYHFMREMARFELNRITRYPVSREDVVARLLSLALTPPEETKGTIDGQVQALSTISEILGLKFSARDADSFFKGKNAEQLRNYALTGDFDVPPAEAHADDQPAGK